MLNTATTNQQLVQRLESGLSEKALQSLRDFKEGNLKYVHHKKIKDYSNPDRGGIYIPEENEYDRKLFQQVRTGQFVWRDKSRFPPTFAENLIDKNGFNPDTAYSTLDPKSEDFETLLSERRDFYSKGDVKDYNYKLTRKIISGEKEYFVDITGDLSSDDELGGDIMRSLVIADDARKMKFMKELISANAIIDTSYILKMLDWVESQCNLGDGVQLQPYCKCDVCETRCDRSNRMKEWPARPVRLMYQYDICAKYVLRLVKAISKESKSTTLSPWVLIHYHGLLTANYVKSIEYSERRVVPMMDQIRKTLGLNIGNDIKEAVVDVKDIAGGLQSTLKECAEMVSSPTVNINGMQEATAALNKLANDGLSLNNPSIDKIAKDGVSVNLGVSGKEEGSFLSKISTLGIEQLFSWLLSFCPPLKTMFDKVSEVGSSHPTVKALLSLFVCVSLETIRMKVPHNKETGKCSKWFNLLAIAAYAFAIFSGNEYVKTFATAYYGGTVLIKLCKWAYDTFMSEKDDEEEETLEGVTFKTIATSDLTEGSLLEKYMESAIKIITGVTDVCSIRNLCLAIGMYKTLVNGGAMVIDSVFNILIDIVNKLGSPFGFEFFKKAYSKYPILYEIIDFLNMIKAKVDKNELPTQKEIRTFEKYKSDLNLLDVKIPLTSDFSTYRSMLRQLQAMATAVTIILRSHGLYRSGRRKASFHTLIAGCPGTAKSNIANAMLDACHFNEDTAEEYNEYQAARVSRVYYYKAGTKFMDGATSNHTDFIIDDLGQTKKATDAESCIYLQFVDKIINNSSATINKSMAGAKDLEVFNNQNTISTTNLRKLDPENTWVADPQAVLRRIHSTNGCAYVFEPKREYLTRDPSSWWGYKVNASLQAKTAFDPNAYRIRKLDWGTGEFLVDEEGAALPSMTHEQFMMEWFDNKRKHDTKEDLLLANMTTLGEDPTFNPMIQGPLDLKMSGLSARFKELVNEDVFPDQGFPNNLRAVDNRRARRRGFPQQAMADGDDEGFEECKEEESVVDSTVPSKFRLRFMAGQYVNGDGLPLSNPLDSEQEKISEKAKFKVPQDWARRYASVMRFLLSEDGSTINYMNAKELRNRKDMSDEEKDLYEEAISTLEIKPPEVLETEKNYTDFDDVDKYIDYLFKRHEDALCMFARAGRTDFLSKASSYVWASIHGEEWATYAASHANELNDLIQRVYIDKADFLVGKNNWVYITQSLDPRVILEVFRGWYHSCVRMASRILHISRLFGWTVSATIKELWNKPKDMSWYEVMMGSLDRVTKFLTYAASDLFNHAYMTIASFFDFNSLYVKIAIQALPPIIMGVYAANQVVAMSDSYNHKIKRDPMSKKCKESKMTVRKCSCIDCIKFRDTYAKVTATSEIASEVMNDCTCDKCKIKACSCVLKLNDADKQNSMIKRCVYNMVLFDGDGDVETFSTASNCTFASSELGFYNHHFYLEIVKQYNLNSELKVRFTAYNGRFFDVSAKHMVEHTDETFKEQDIAVWHNKVGTTSLGGGIRNYSEHFKTERDKVAETVRVSNIRYNRRENVIKSSNHVVHVRGMGRATYQNSTIKPSKEYFVNCYVVNYPMEVGMCGAVVLDIEDGKFIGIINAGENGGGSVGYVTPITYEMISMMHSKHNTKNLKTDNLPDDIVETDLVNKKFMQIAIHDDNHSMTDINKIVKTPLYGCIGPCEKIPTFISAWENGDTGEVINCPKTAADKYTKDGPAVSEILLDMATAMLASTVEKAAPDGKRAFRLSTMEAVNGAYEESPMSVKTSAGGRYILENITKKQIVRRDENDELDFSSPEGQKFLADVEEKTQQALDGQIHKFYINEFGKAELIEKSKVEKGKMRLVCGVDADKVIADKKEFTCVSYFLKRCGIVAGLCLAEDPNSMDSHVMAMSLAIYNQIIDLDHKGWDTTFYRYKLHQCMKFIDRIMYDATDEHRKAMWTCAESLMYGIHMMHVRYVESVDKEGNKKELFVKLLVFVEWYFGMLSGCFLTLLFNTIGNAIDQRYLNLCAYCEEILGINYLEYNPMVHGIIPFEEIENNILYFVKGDDVLISKSKALTYVNFSNLRKVALYHNMEITTQAKDGSIDAEIMSLRRDGNPSDVSFCKRRYRFDKEYNRFVACLAMESIMCMLYYSDNGMREYRQVVDTALKELSNWGREIFHMCAPKIDLEVYRAYRYRSPYANYELARAAIIGGMNDRTARNMAEFFSDRDLSSEGEKELNDCLVFVQSLKNKGDSEKVNPPIGVKMVTKTLEKKIKEQLAESKRRQLESVNQVDGLSNNTIPMMEQPITKEAKVTTTLLNDGIEESKSGVEPERIDSYLHNFDDLAAFLARPKVILNGNWTTGSVANAELFSFSIASVLEDSALWRNKISGFNLIRGTCEVTLTANANPFQQGELIMHFIPQYVERGSPTGMNKGLIQKTQQMHVVYNCRDTESKLLIPYVAPTHYYDMTLALYDWGNVFLSVLAPMKTEPTVGSQTVSYTLWVRFINCEFAAPAVNIQEGPLLVATMDKEEKAVNERPISSTLRAAGKVAGKLGSIPMLATHLKPAAWALDTAARMAHTLGYSKPLQNDKITIMTPQTNRYAAVSDGPDTAVELGLCANNSVAIKNIASVRTHQDEMSFEFYKSIESYFDVFNLTTAQTAGTTVKSVYASPLNFRKDMSEVYGTATVGYALYTPVGYISQLFQYWRGSMIIRLKAVKTQLVTARLIITWSPGITTDTGLEDEDMTAGRYVWDLAVSDSIEIKMPWLIAQNYLGLDDISGKLSIKILNPLRANASCADNVDIMMFVKFDKDFELAAPIANRIAKPPLVFAAMDEVVDVQSLGSQPIENSTTKYSEVGMGEYFTSVKQLLTRYNNIQQASLGNNTRINPFFFSAVGINTTTGARIYPNEGGDVISYIGLMYGCYRGGMKLGVHSNAQVNGSTWDVSIVTRPGDDLYFSNAINTYSGSNWYLPNNTPVLNMGITNVPGHYVYAKVPYYVTTLFSMVMPRLTAVADTTDRTLPEVWCNFFSSNASSVCLVHRAVSDEFVFSNFICVPPLLTSYVQE